MARLSPLALALLSIASASLRRSIIASTWLSMMPQRPRAFPGPRETVLSRIFPEQALGRNHGDAPHMIEWKFGGRYSAPDEPS